MNLDKARAAVMAANAHNLFGQLGPMCPTCSGLGKVLRLGTPGAPTTMTARCVCGGTGVDREAVRATEMTSLLQRLEQAEAGQRALMAKLGITSQFNINGTCSRQAWAELVAWATADGTAVNTSTTETIIHPNVTLPANYMQDSRKMRLRVVGKYGTHSSGTLTLQFFVRWGGISGTLICKSAVMVQVASITNGMFEFNVELQTRTNGATGTIMGNGVAHIFGATAPNVGSATGAPAVSPMTNGGQTTPAAATCDLTADTALTVSGQHGASNAANTFTGLDYTLESMN